MLVNRTTSSSASLTSSQQMMADPATEEFNLNVLLMSAIADTVTSNISTLADVGEDMAIVNSTNATYRPYSQRPETYIVPVVFLFIFVTGVIGNITLIILLIREQLIRTPSYLYILNLSLGDLAVILGTVPFVATIYTFESWPYGEFVCKFSEFIRDVSIGVSVLTLSAMSIDRYRAAFSNVMRPSAGRGAPLTFASAMRSQTGLVMVSIWLLSICFAGPTAYFSFVWEVQLDTRTIYVCYPYPDELGPLYPKAVVLTKCILFYVVPMLIIACCYVSIAIHLLAKAKSGPDGQSSREPLANGNAQSAAAAAGFKRSSKRSQSRARVILLLVIIFMVCFFPNHLFMLWWNFHPDSQSLYNDFWHCWRIVAFCLTFLNSCLNPITLYLTSEQFKGLFNKYLLRCCKPVAYRAANGNGNVSGANSTNGIEVSNATRQVRIEMDSNVQDVSL